MPLWYGSKGRLDDTFPYLTSGSWVDKVDKVGPDKVIGL